MQKINERDDVYIELWPKIQLIRERWKNLTELNRLITEWEEEYGSTMDEFAQKILAEEVHKRWRAYATKNQLATVQDFVKSAWEGWSEGEFSIERGSNGVQIYCTRCPMADAYRQIGKESWGLIFHCSEDPHMVSGFNQQLNFKRTKTLMAGDDCCDHYYFD